MGGCSLVMKRKEGCAGIRNGCQLILSSVSALWSSLQQNAPFSAFRHPLFWFESRWTLYTKNSATIHSELNKTFSDRSHYVKQYTSSSIIELLELPKLLYLSKLLDGFLKDVTWICQNRYMDLSRLLYGFVWVYNTGWFLILLLCTKSCVNVFFSFKMNVTLLRTNSL